MMGCGPKDRDGNTYKTVKIGEQLWLAENLKVVTEDSWCYDNKPENCEKYGRLYTWAAAMNLPKSCNDEWCGDENVFHQGICPEGFHIPSEEELEIMLMLTETKIQSDTWLSGRNQFGFSLLSSGLRSDKGEFQRLGGYAYLWSSSQRYGYSALSLFAISSDALMGVISKDYGAAVRCIQNYQDP